MDTKPTKSTPRDVFMHLLLIVTLYASTFSLLRLVFGLIDAAFPDALNMYYDPGSSLRWAIATLIIVFPVFLWTSRLLLRDRTSAAAETDSRIRKWLLYLTLFLTALLIIGDLVALILSFLNGEITTHFVLKVLAILVVAAAIFRYYLIDLRRSGKEVRGTARVFGIGASVVVLAALVAGFFVAGSPFKQRAVQFDNQRVNDLQTLQYQIVNRWQQKGALPANVDELRDSISNFTPPIDPQTGASYEYSVQDPLSFELCATFNLPTQQVPGRVTPVAKVPAPVGVPVGSLEGSWDHQAGRQCFDRTIDPQLYPPVKK